MWGRRETVPSSRSEGTAFCTGASVAMGSAIASRGSPVIRNALTCVGCAGRGIAGQRTLPNDAVHAGIMDGDVRALSITISKTGALAPFCQPSRTGREDLLDCLIGVRVRPQIIDVPRYSMCVAPGCAHEFSPRAGYWRLFARRASERVRYGRALLVPAHARPSCGDMHQFDDTSSIESPGVILGAPKGCTGMS